MLPYAQGMGERVGERGFRWRQRFRQLLWGRVTNSSTSNVTSLTDAMEVVAGAMPTLFPEGVLRVSSS